MAGQNPGNCEYGSFWHVGENNPADFEFGYFVHIGPIKEGKVYTKVSGIWEEVHPVRYKNSGIWGKSKVYVKIIGDWIEIYDGT